MQHVVEDEHGRHAESSRWLTEAGLVAWRQSCITPIRLFFRTKFVQSLEGNGKSRCAWCGVCACSFKYCSTMM